MLEPRETDIPALFLIFVVLPLVTYFILGKWSETSKRKERISLIASGAVEEALQVDHMAVGGIIPMVHMPNSGIHQCARCFGPAGTRCSQCKSVWYCSGRCQIVHWRNVHKLECQQLGKDCHRPFLKCGSEEGSRGRVSYGETTEQCTFQYKVQQPSIDGTFSKDFVLHPLTALTPATTSGMALSASEKSIINQRSAEIGPFLTGQIDSLKTVDSAVLSSSGEGCGSSFTLPNSSQPSEDPYLREGNFSLSERHANSPHVSKDGADRALDGGNNFGIVNSSTVAISGTKTHETQTQMTLRQDKYPSQRRIPCTDETKGLNCSSERTSMKRSSKSKVVSHSNSNGIEQHKYQKSRMAVSKEQPSSDAELKTQTAKESGIATTKDNFPLQESNWVANLDVTRMKGMKKSVKVDNHQQLQDSTTKKRKVKMIFPYEEFVKCFQYENFNATPRGLVNCGNSCYANAVLQCLTFTKPLFIYLLRQTHSRAGCAKDWCLTCELERLVMMLRQNGGPLSPINILMYIRSLNAQIGDGSQEDAHEFLRLLVASMQTICLEGFGGENVVDPRLQDTTFIQHTFGGCLRSKVKCLRCHHESERYEKMMDLTLEIFGWVESLEDALTQFTSSEDLDGDNMYRCARCATYVHARKQLHIKEAPNILTIVLKRFQEGNYGKINKCITFPEMLDMIPFMTGTDDIPPLYMLYAVVVHLDTSNASFSGHYISYVKDLQGNWYRVDDTEVQPVELSQVMSEGAYILFYMRSYPRPARCGKSSRHQAPCNGASRGQRASRAEGNNLVGRETNAESSKGVLIRENRSRPSSLRNYAEFSDSDWSVFTSSDDSSFTTESTRDSVDVPFSSIFQSLYPVDSPSRRTISCSVFPGSKPRTGFAAREERGFVEVSCVNQTCVDCTRYDDEDS
ncbi:ubiquitin carboxyl-terminal hydrolase 15 [Salvia miltiorrhiza]|uniref:ubiquitin carboxyl-terminal hydrolase 15 n=1 Tax=Salvia miltiorrhiza TaxID=226208 RepID=UPI0025AB9B70|nr:ubiquitin carboxyl-terminal hydrolase 15 [Salvia miltiorrhiza]XP_057777405.1 ubiquitin carboxyl-terminal hydrolase 15 [Salvia miltiorrhiza]XP_057777406.1 ubiquitin carboxyl-terminal hydrolase 15 [Salvia miltiorrhiza]XP_057777407.1 ubiquitin carboxyl-terminal hydrolase 15 [Salvia miltiorrhiza]XP_057777408.1 ubiquitin carboxyl-terminal hydrolase 15 [Salvia miltiorrhiza]